MSPGRVATPAVPTAEHLLYRRLRAEHRQGQRSHSLKDEGGTSGFFLLSVHNTPGIHALPELEGEHSLLEEVLRFLRGGLEQAK